MDRKIALALMISVFFLALVPFGSAETCGIYIYGLDAQEDGLISFFINNTGDIDADITYTVYVGLNELERVEELSLDAGEGERRESGYSFLYGNYWIRVEAESDCGSRDFKEMVYAILEPLPKVCSGPEGVEGDVRCDREMGSLLECRDGSWIYHGEDESCKSKCYPYCTGEKLYPECRVDIETLDFLDNILEGNALKLETRIKNTGMGEEIINLKLHINGKLQRDYLLPELGPEESITETLYYYPRAGENEFRLEAVANCSASDSKEGTFLVIEKAPEPEPQPEPEPGPLVTSVSIGPKSLDIIISRGKTLELDIGSSRSQEFIISVTGMEEGWLQYAKQLEVEGKKRAYIYITPQKLGTYNLTITVQGEVEGFQEEVSLYVVPEQQEEEEPKDFFSGISGFLAENRLIIFGIMTIVILVLVISLGTRYWSERGRI